jgi:hypothetical protein
MDILTPGWGKEGCGRERGAIIALTSDCRGGGIFNDRGSALLPVKVMPRIAPGVVWSDDV